MQKKSSSLKTTFITGALFLTLAGVLTRVIGFFYRIFLSRLIGAEGLGIYQLMAPVTALGFAVTAAGIQTSISRFVSMEMGRKNAAGAKQYLFIGLAISLLLSTGTGMLIFRSADVLAEVWLGDIRCASMLRVLSLSFAPSCIHACINGYYYGLKKTAIPAVCQLTEQLARVGSVYLFYCISVRENQPLSLDATMWGVVIGEIASTLVSLSVTRFPESEQQPARSKGHSYAATKKKQAVPLFSYTRNLIYMALPLTANRVALNLFASLENTMIPKSLRMFGYTNSEALSVYGILTGMSMSVVMFPSVITNSISVLLLPTISEAEASGNNALIRRTIRTTVATCLSLGFLCTMGFLYLGDYAGNLLFDNALAGTFIVTLGWICPFLYLGATLGSILHGLGFPGLTFLLNMSACGVRILFVLFLVPRFGIKSYLWGILASQIAAALFSLIALYIICSRRLPPASVK